MLFVLVILILLNWLVFPNFTGQRIAETDYGTFIDKVDSGKVEKVMFKDGYIYFTVGESESSEDITLPGGKTQRVQTIYQTGQIDDPTLVNRLLNADSPNENNKIEFSQIIPRQNSPIMNFFLLWVLPGLIFYIIWKQTSKSLMARGTSGGGGNFMSFGSSGAKIYADSDVSTAGSRWNCLTSKAERLFSKYI